MTALDRAREDLAAGRAWKARERLESLLVVRQDREVLELLATTLEGMGDLPKAGAIWFVLGRDDEGARASLDAWRQRYGDDDAQWRSIPRQLRPPRSAHGRRLAHVAWDPSPPPHEGPLAPRLFVVSWRGLKEAAFEIGCSFVVAATVALLVIGVVTVVGWL